MQTLFRLRSALQALGQAGHVDRSTKQTNTKDKYRQIQRTNTDKYKRQIQTNTQTLSYIGRTKDIAAGVSQAFGCDKLCLVHFPLKRHNCATTL